jgi:hypothetical protein
MQIRTCQLENLMWGGRVLLKVNPKKSSLKLGSYTKLATRFCGPFEILDRIGPVA